MQGVSRNQVLVMEAGWLESDDVISKTGGFYLKEFPIILDVFIVVQFGEMLTG